jgi:hypothetical protein
MPDTFYHHSEEYDTASGPFATLTKAAEHDTPDMFTTILVVDEKGKIVDAYRYDPDENIWDIADSPYEGMNIESL